MRGSGWRQTQMEWTLGGWLLCRERGGAKDGVGRKMTEGGQVRLVRERDT